MKKISLLGIVLFIFTGIIFSNIVFAESDVCGIYSLESSPRNIGYEAGFYSGWLTQDGVTTNNFCAIPNLYPSEDQEDINGWRRAHIDGGIWTRNCIKDWNTNPEVNTCTARLLPNEESVCLGTNIARDTKPDSFDVENLCQRADAHGFVDPGMPSLSNITGGDDQPWQWTCGGPYYNEKVCQAPSKGKCMDTENIMYDDFQESDEICENGTVQGFTFNEETYKRERTCKGSEEQYNVQCSAQKTTEQGECNFIYNGKSFDSLDTGMDLCSKGTIDYNSFQFNYSNNDSEFGRSWTCKGSIESMNSSCFAHKNIFKGMCNSVLIAGPQEILTTGDNLCTMGEGTGLTLSDDESKRQRICEGSREKDNTQCETDVKTIEGKCGIKNGSLCEELTSDNQDLCEKGTVSDWYRDEEYKKRNWKCLGNPQSLSVQCSAQKTSPGLCNEDINGKTMTYDEIITYPLCSDGTTDVVLDGNSVDGIWKWTCSGLAGGSGDQCSVKQYQTGSCANLIGMVKTLPSNLCNGGKPIDTKISDGSRVRTCEGFNGAPSIQCSIECIDGKCEAGGDGENTPDGIIPQIGPGETCNDIDGCWCGENRIFNGTICKGGYNPNDENDINNPNYKMPIFRPTLGSWGSLYDENMMLPGNADLIIDHTTQTGQVKKLEKVKFKISFKNDGPDTAYGTYVAYKYSDLIENIEGSVPFTIVTLDSVIDNDKQIQENIDNNNENNDVNTEYNNNNTGNDTSGDILTGGINQDINQPGDVNANNNSTVDSNTSSSTKTYDDVYKNVIYFYVGTLEPGETGEIIFTGTIKNTISGGLITNTAMIQSRLNDPNKLNNTKSASIYMIIDYLSGGLQLINPLLYIKPVLDKWNSVIERINAKTDFRDVIIGNPWYMHIMTVQRNGIMKGYEYKYSTMFMPKKCISRAEYLVVMARIMHMTNNTDNIYEGDLKTTPYIDIPNSNSMLVKYINWSHRRGLIDIFKAGKSLPNVLGANKPVKHKEAKAILYRLYKIMNANTKVLKPLLVGTGTNFSNKCVTREETAYTIAHILRGNPNIVMGFNDIFLSKLYDFLLPKNIIQRRKLLSRLIFKMRQMPPTSLFKLGLDKETLIGTLNNAMKGKIYNPIHNSDSIQNFFYEVSDDEYDRYIKSLYK